MVEKIIKRPIAVSMCVVAVIVLAAVSVGIIPISLMPPIDIPQIVVNVNAPSFSAKEIQQNVLEPIERALVHTPNLENMQAEAKDGKGSISLDFDYGIDVNYAFIDVNERIDMCISSLPRSIERPSVVKIGASDIPAFFLNITFKDSIRNDDKIIELSNFASNVLAKRLEQLSSVSFVDISGRLKPQIVIRPDLSKLQTLRISPQTIEIAIENQLLQIENISIKDGQYQYSVRLDGNMKSKTDIENCMLNIEGRIWSLKEIANIDYQAQELSEIILSDGRKAISMAIIKQADARMGDLKKDIKQLTTALENEYPEIQFTVTRDQTALLNYSLNNLVQSLCFGILLACFVLFFFMKDYRTLLLVVLSIPLSLLLSLFLFFLLGVSLNIISLSGLMLGVGMMIDNSIIVIDNIAEKRSKGIRLIQATVSGTQEVFAPLLSSVLTTCAIFIPLVFLNGMAGAMFYDQAMAISIGLFSSLIIAMTILPTYYFLLYKKKTHSIPKASAGIWITKYEQILKWVFRHQKAFWCIILLFVISAICMYPFLNKQTLPTIERDDIIFRIHWNEPVTVEENAMRIQKLNMVINAYTNHSTSISGRHHFLLPHTKETELNQAQLYIKAKDPIHLEKGITQVKEYIQKTYPQALLSIEPADNIFDMIFKAPEAMLVAKLYAKNGEIPNPDPLNRLLEKITQVNPQLELDAVQWKESINLYPNDRLLAIHNIKHTDLLQTLEMAFGSKNILKINTDNQSVEVLMGSENKTLHEILSMTDICFGETEQTKQCVPVKNFIIETVGIDFANIFSGKEGAYYPLHLRIERKDVAKIMCDIQETVEQDANFEVSFSGDYFNSQKMISQLLIILIVSFLLLFFILATQFESLRQPLLILTEIIIDLSGVIVILFIFRQSLNLMSLIGIIMMSGIVINDSILKIDTYNRLRKNGNSILKTIIEGGRLRVRPIVMTSLTTILAILPLLFSSGMGADLQTPLSIVLVGGMFLGTLFSLFGLPLVYYYFSKKG